MEGLVNYYKLLPDKCRINCHTIIPDVDFAKSRLKEETIRKKYLEVLSHKLASSILEEKGYYTWSYNPYLFETELKTSYYVFTPDELKEYIKKIAEELFTVSVTWDNTEKENVYD